MDDFVWCFLESLGLRQSSNYGHGFDRAANRSIHSSSSESDYEHHNSDRTRLNPSGMQALAEDVATAKQQNH